MKIITTLILATFLTFNAAADKMMYFQSGHVQTEVDCMAEAMYWEGRGEGKLGMVLVGEVIKNRVDDVIYEFKHLSTACEVAHQPSRTVNYWECSFSYHCDGKGEGVFESDTNKVSYELAYMLAYNLITNSDEFYLDIAEGALYYTRNEIWRDWMDNTVVTIVYLDHTFRKRRDQEPRKIPAPSLDTIQGLRVPLEPVDVNYDTPWEITYE